MQHRAVCLPPHERPQRANVGARVEVAVVARAVVSVEELGGGAMVEALELEIVLTFESEAEALGAAAAPPEQIL